MPEAFLLFLTLNFIFSRKVMGDWVLVAPNAKYTRVSLRQNNNLENEGPNGKCHINLSAWFVTHEEKIFQYWHPWQSSYQLIIQIRLFWNKHLASSVGCTQFSSVAQSCLTLCDTMKPSTPGLPVHHQLPEFTQTHVHWVGDAIQPSHPLSSPSPPAPNPSQQQGVNSLH